MKSLRQGLLVRLLPALLVMLVVQGVVLYQSAKHLDLKEFDTNLEHAAGLVATLLFEDPEGHLELNFADEWMPDYSLEHGKGFFQLWRADGSLLERSRSLAGMDLPRPKDLGYEAVYWDLELPNGRPGRAIGVRVSPNPNGEGAAELESGPESTAIDLVLAFSREDLDHLLQIVLLSALAGGGALALAAIGIVIAGVRRAMRPLDEITAAVSRLNPGEKSDPSYVQGAPREIQPLLLRLEELLGRVSSTLERERRTTAHIAHELRTPITELHSAVSVALRWPEDRELTSQALTEALEIGDQMRRYVESILELARRAASKEAIDRPRVDLEQLVREQCRVLASSADARSLQVRLELAKASLRVDAEALDLALGNLLSNAVIHCPAGGQVVLKTRVQGAEVTLELRNSNPGLTSADLELLREPFWRRHRADGKGSGLGLELTQGLVTSMGGRLEFELEDDAWFIARLRFPAAEA